MTTPFFPLGDPTKGGTPPDEHAPGYENLKREQQKQTCQKCGAKEQTGRTCGRCGARMEPEG